MTQTNSLASIGILGILVVGAFGAVSVGFENQAGSSTLAGDMEALLASAFEIAPLVLVALLMLGLVRVVADL